MYHPQRSGVSSVKTEIVDSVTLDRGSDNPLVRVWQLYELVPSPFRTRNVVFAAALVLIPKTRPMEFQQTKQKERKECWSSNKTKTETKKEMLWFWCQWGIFTTEVYRVYASCTRGNSQPLSGMTLELYFMDWMTRALAEKSQKEPKSFSCPLTRSFTVLLYVSFCFSLSLLSLFRARAPSLSHTHIHTYFSPTNTDFCCSEQKYLSNTLMRARGVTIAVSHCAVSCFTLFIAGMLRVLPQYLEMCVVLAVCTADCGCTAARHVLETHVEDVPHEAALLAQTGRHRPAQGKGELNAVSTENPISSIQKKRWTTAVTWMSPDVPSPKGCRETRLFIEICPFKCHTESQCCGFGLFQAVPLKAERLELSHPGVVVVLFVVLVVFVVFLDWQPPSSCHQNAGAAWPRHWQAPLLKAAFFTTRPEREDLDRVRWKIYPVLSQKETPRISFPGSVWTPVCRACAESDLARWNVSSFPSKLIVSYHRKLRVHSLQEGNFLCGAFSQQWREKTYGAVKYEADLSTRYCGIAAVRVSCFSVQQSKCTLPSRYTNTSVQVQCKSRTSSECKNNLHLGNEKIWRFCCHVQLSQVLLGCSVKTGGIVESCTRRRHNHHRCCCHGRPLPLLGQTPRQRSGVIARPLLWDSIQIKTAVLYVSKW